MSNPFGTAEMAAGYATSRPPVHRHILRRALTGVVDRALDVGCGAGVSTNALDEFALHRIGIEPAEAMLRPWSTTTALGARFAVACAEAIPLRTGSVDLMTAAGSLNYA